MSVTQGILEVVAIHATCVVAQEADELITVFCLASTLDEIEGTRVIAASERSESDEPVPEISICRQEQTWSALAVNHSMGRTERFNDLDQQRWISNWIKVSVH